jgi:hypothetical protein
MKNNIPNPHPCTPLHFMERGMNSPKAKKGVRWLLVIGFLILSFHAPAWADGQAGLDIAVLKAGVGARPLGMGSAFTAIADNVDAPYWNPAGLSQIKNYEISAMQTKLSTDADHYYISYVMPFLSGGLGLSWIQIGMGSITQTTSTTDAFNEVENLGIFSYYSNAYILAYGQNIMDNLSFGINAKYLTSDMPGLVSIEGGSAYGYSVTPGLLYKPTKYLSIGFKIDEMVNYQKWGTDTEETVPSKYRLGLAYNTLILNSYPLILSADLSQINKAGYVAEANGGAELTIGQIAFRLGTSDNSLTAGAGFGAEHIRIDYAYVTQTALSKDNVHRVSLTGIW